MIFRTTMEEIVVRTDADKRTLEFIILPNGGMRTQLRTERLVPELLSRVEPRATSQPCIDTHFHHRTRLQSKNRILRVGGDSVRKSKSRIRRPSRCSRLSVSAALCDPVTEPLNSADTVTEHRRSASGSGFHPIS